jgi:hypothetical protein
VVLNAHPTGGTVVTLYSTDVATDQSGYCNDPDNGSVEAGAYDCQIASLAFVNRTIVVTFAPEPGVGTPVPDAESVTDPENWAILGGVSLGGLFRGGREDGAIVIDRIDPDPGADPLVWRVVTARAIFPGETIQADASAVATDLGGTCGYAGSATDVIPGTGVAYEDAEPMLSATIAACATAMSVVVGRPTSRLRVPLAIDELTEVGVESTLGWPEAGTIMVQGERIDYTTRYPDGVRGLTRDTARAGLYAVNDQQPWPILTEVVVIDPPWWSQAASAKNDLVPSRAVGIGLDRLAADMGVPRPLANMSEADLQEYVQSRTWKSLSVPYDISRVLRAMFRWAESSGADTAIEVGGRVWLPLTGVAFDESLFDRPIDIGGTICRIVTAKDVDGTAHVLIDGVAGALHGTGALAGGVLYAWSLLAFRCDGKGGVAVGDDGSEGASQKAARVDIALYPDDGAEVPYTYMMESGEVSDGRPIAGITLSDVTVPSVEDDEGSPVYGEWKAPFFMLDPYASVVETVTRDVFAAGVLARATTRS